MLLNISTSGCAMTESTLTPELEEKVFISFNLPGKNEPVEMRAKVLRIKPQLAVQFVRIEPETESLIVKFFAADSRTLINQKSAS